MKVFFGLCSVRDRVQLRIVDSIYYRGCLGIEPEAEFLDEIQTSPKSFPPCYSVTSTALPWDFQLLTVSAKEKGGIPDKIPNPLPYGLRKPYRNVKYENSQDYAQKPQWNRTFMNSAPERDNSNISGRVSDPDPDPDPDLIRIQWGQWIRIRIRNPDPDPDPGGQKWPTKVEKNSCFEVLDGLFCELQTSSVTWTYFMEA